MLLTVIAVATLLVAVVGATFAYFSLSVTSEAQTSTATVKTDTIPLITLDGGSKTLSMYLTAADMEKSISDEGVKPYYAVLQSMSEGTSLKQESKQNHTVATLKSTGGPEGETYTCNLTITVTKGGDMASLVAGDAKLYLSGLGVQTTDVPEEGLDLYNVSDNKVMQTTVDVAANSFTGDLKADVEFNNTKADQSSLAGKSLTVEIKTELTGCTLKTGD